MRSSDRRWHGFLERRTPQGAFGLAHILMAIFQRENAILPVMTPLAYRLRYDCAPMAGASVEDRRFMGMALEEARKAFDREEVPVGAVLVGDGGDLLARAHNRTIANSDPTAHAEVSAIREAALRVGNYRLTGSTLYVTVEPCCMCAGALVWARIGRLVYGAADPKGGAAGSLYRIPDDVRLNHRVEILSGVREKECRAMMQRFFRERREPLHPPLSPGERE